MTTPEEGGQPRRVDKVLRDVADGVQGSQTRRAGPFFRWWHREKEDTSSRDWQDAEWSTNNRLDDFLFLPPLFWLVALVDYDDEAVLLFFLWALVLLIWMPWIMFRVAMRGPPADHHRAAAVLAFALLAWVIPFLLSVISVKVAVLAGFPFLYVIGGWAMLMAVRLKPAPQSPRRRKVLLRTGASIYGLFAALLLLLVSLAFTGGRARAEALGGFGWFMVLLGMLAGGAWAFASFKLFMAAGRPGPLAKTVSPASP